MEIQSIKNKFGIIGRSEALNRAIETAVRVAPTDLSILISGESGTGKETIPKIIHGFSRIKNGPYFAVNCGAIPEGTIDSELFGHEKGSFTGAYEQRKGYFETADGGTIFLDEVAEMPIETQARLLRVLESGEFIKVGSAKVQKTKVRVIAATNKNLIEEIQKGKFREDLYYRINTVPILLPPLRQRKEDIHLLFRKFASDFAEQYKMPAITLDPEAVKYLEEYSWEGNIRQLKNLTEQLSILEETREVGLSVLKAYLPQYNQLILARESRGHAQTPGEPSFASEREILYKILFDMRKDVNELKTLVHDLREERGFEVPFFESRMENRHIPTVSTADIIDTEDEEDETLSLIDKEKEMIQKALMKHKGRRKPAADELKISERTLYRKIKDYGLE